jgi:pyrimidine-specific ribonucleoside hydrolase
VTVTPVIIDCDTGIDDAFALMFAVRHPGIDLRAVTCVAGNANVERVVSNTCYVLDVAGAGDIPVGRGATAPLLAPVPDTGHFHGLDGLGGFSRQSDRRTSPMSAVELLRHELLAAIGNDEPITLIATAPQTNIALLLRAHPEVAAGIERLVFMGGSASIGNVTAVAEFNVFHDPEAAAITLAAARDLDIPVTMYGLDVFEQVRVDLDDAALLRSRLDPACQLAGALIVARAKGENTASIGDAGTVLAIADPNGLGTERLPVRVELGHGYTRGQTVVDRRPWPDQIAVNPLHTTPTTVDVAVSVDARGYADLWLQTLIG